MNAEWHRLLRLFLRDSNNKKPTKKVAQEMHRVPSISTLIAVLKRGNFVSKIFLKLRPEFGPSQKMINLCLQYCLL